MTEEMPEETKDQKEDRIVSQAFQSVTDMIEEETTEQKEDRLANEAFDIITENRKAHVGVCLDRMQNIFLSFLAGAVASCGKDASAMADIMEGLEKGNAFAEAYIGSKIEKALGFVPVPEEVEQDEAEEEEADSEEEEEDPGHFAYRTFPVQ